MIMLLSWLFILLKNKKAVEPAGVNQQKRNGFGNN